jgi:hypothetical protein
VTNQDVGFVLIIIALTFVMWLVGFVVARGSE